MMSVRRALIALCLAVSPAALAAAPVPKEQLLMPPADADHFVVVSEAGKHGDEWRWTLADGSIAYRESILLRGLVFETGRGRPSRQGRKAGQRHDSRRHAERRLRRNVSRSTRRIGRWKSPVDEGQRRPARPAYTSP